MRQQAQPKPLAPENSRRIDTLRFMLVIAIVVIHARGHNDVVGGLELGPATLGGGAWFLQEILSSVLARTAVPLFFLFSGFLAARSLAKKGYTRLLRCRSRTLLIPYIVWNLLAFAFACVSSPDRLAAANPLHIFGITSIPAAYHFWFVRDLIVLVVLCPILVFLAQRAPLPTAIGALVLWFYPPAWLGAGDMAVHPAAICFFQLGVYLCYHQRRLSSAWQRAVTIAYLPLAVADVFVSNDAWIGAAFHNVVLLAGMIAVWQFGAWLINRRPLPAVLTGSAFMVYAAHEPLLGVLKKISYYLFKPDGDLSVTAIYLLTATLTIVSCVIANHLASRGLPRTHALVTGGR